MFLLSLLSLVLKLASCFHHTTWHPGPLQTLLSIRSLFDENHKQLDDVEAEIYGEDGGKYSVVSMVTTSQEDQKQVSYFVKLIKYQLENASWKPGKMSCPELKKRSWTSIMRLQISNWSCTKKTWEQIEEREELVLQSQQYHTGWQGEANTYSLDVVAGDAECRHAHGYN